MRKNKGITLIALVITIIVLLILAGVSLSLIAGTEGILGKATKATIANRAGEVEEIVEMWKVENRMNQYVEDEVMTEEELIADLKGKKLVYEEELDEEEKMITIGTKEIYYGLEEKVEYTSGNVFEYTPEGYITGIKEAYIEGTEMRGTTGGEIVECNILASELGGVLNIPNEIDGVKIVGIGENALAQIVNLSSVRIPKSVVSIENEAFKGCFDLDTVIIGENVTRIGNSAFYFCRDLERVIIGKKVTTIGEYAFWAAGFTTINYTGTEEQWKNITIGSCNDELKRATINYNYGK